MAMSSDEITLVRRRSFSVVPDDILLDKRMSLRARLVLGWMVGRPEGWIFSVRQMQVALGMTEAIWVSIRNEMQRAGYYRQERIRKDGGRWAWIKTVTDVAESPSPSLPGMVNAIPGEAMDGAAMHGSTIHGAAMPGQLGDIPIGGKPRGSKQEDLPPPGFEQVKTPPPPSSTAQKRSAAPAKTAPVVADLDDLVTAAYWQATQSGKPIKNPSAWRTRVRQRLQASGTSQEDLLCLEAWQSHLEAKARHQSEKDKRAATVEQVADPETARRHLRNFRRQHPNSIDGETTAIQHQDDGRTPQ
jgi:hypothetical protein